MFKNVFKKVRLFFLTSLLVLAILAIITLGPVTGSSTISLYVNGYDARIEGWTKVGSSPYLSTQNQPTDYVHVSAKDKEIGDFSFQDLSGSPTINSVNLYLYCDAGSEKINVYVWNGSAWSAPYTFQGSGWAWRNVDVSAFLNTDAKVDVAKIYLASKAVGAWAGTVQADCAYLYVDYTVLDTTPPTWSNAGTNNTRAGQPTRFFVKWTDNVNMSGYIFGTNNTGSWQNDTWTAWSPAGTPKWSNVTKTLTSTPSAKVEWRVWANDTSNNWNNTGILSLVTFADTTPPTWSNAGTNNTIGGQPTLFHVKWTDNAELSGFIFGTNNTGTWANDTWTSMSGTTDWSNVTKVLTSTGTVVQWRVWANDTSNNWNNTGILSVIVNRPPVASFTENATTVFIGEVIRFNPSASYDPDGYIASYFWDFGDGTNITIFTLDYSVNATSPYITVVPTSTTNGSLTPGSSYTIAIYTNYNGSDITAWQFTLYFNPDVLYGGINQTDTWTANGTTTIFTLTQRTILEGSVKVYVNQTLIANVTQRTDTWTGDGTTTTFNTTKTPVFANSEEVYVNQTLVTKVTEGTDTWTGDNVTKVFNTTGSPITEYSEEVSINFTDTWTGDNVTKVFDTTEKPVIEGSEKVYVNQTLMIKPDNYTINYVAGRITFTTAPGVGAEIEATYRALMTRDTDYTINYATGAINFTTAPETGAKIEATYEYGHYTIDYTAGAITFITAPGAGAEINATYLHPQYFIDYLRRKLTFITAPGAGAQIKAIYQYGGITNGDLITRDKNINAKFYRGTFNNTVGNLSLTSAYFYFAAEPAPITSGPGTLAYITFTVVGMGCSNITLGNETQLIGYTEGGYGNSYLIIDAETMPDHIQHGYFSNVITVDHAYSATGDYTVTLTVTDDDGATASVSAIKHVLSVGVVHDINITNVSALPAEVPVGASVSINVTILNEGTEFETFDVKVYYDSNLIENRTDVSLAARASTTLNFSWNTTGISLGNYTIRAEVPAVFNETDLSDNEYVDGAVLVEKGPIADANGPYEGYEGSPITFDASGSTPDGGTIVLYEWDWNNDGSYDESTTSPFINHTWTDDFSGTVGLRVRDSEGLNNTDTASVTVHNVAPIVNAGSDQTVNEGDLVYFNGNFADPGVDTHTIFWDFGDGSNATGTLTPTHVYTDDGVYIVTLNVTDDDGGIGIDTLTVTVGNVAPSVGAGPDQTVNEGDVVSFSGSFTDPGANDTHTIFWDFGDGSNASGTLTPTHVYGDNDVYTVTLTVTDDDGGVGLDTLNVTVYNVAPTVDAGPDQVVRVNQTVSFSGSFTDPGLLDTHTIFWDFDDGSNASGTLTPTHVYTEAGFYTVTLNVTDDDGGSGIDTLNVTVSIEPVHDVRIFSVTPNVTQVIQGSAVNITVVAYNEGTETETFNVTAYANNTEIGTTTIVNLGGGGQYTLNFIWNTTDFSPSYYTISANASVVPGETDTVDNFLEDGTVKVMKYPVADANGPYSGYEGSPITFDASGSTPDGGTIVLYEWDWNNDGSYDESTTSPTINHTWTDDFSGTVGLRVTDDDGLTDTDTALVTVENVAPTANAGPDQTVNEGDVVSFSGSFTDPGWLDTHTIFWDFGDDDNASGTLTPSHVYATAGNYTVTLTVTDDDGGVGLDTLTVTVLEVAAYDVAVIDVVLSANVAYWTWTIQVNVTVKNNGTETVSFNVTAYYFNATATYPIGTQTVTNLDPCNTTNLTFSWPLTDVPDGTYTVKANVTLLDGEDSNPADNEKVDGQLTVRLWGDVDGNGAISILDLKKVKLAYSKLIDEPMADLDGDGEITILDVKKMKLIYSGLLKRP